MKNRLLLMIVALMALLLPGQFFAMQALKKKFLGVFKKSSLVQEKTAGNPERMGQADDQASEEDEQAIGISGALEWFNEIGQVADNEGFARYLGCKDNALKPTASNSLMDLYKKYYPTFEEDSDRRCARIIDELMVSFGTMQGIDPNEWQIRPLNECVIDIPDDIIKKLIAVAHDKKKPEVVAILAAELGRRNEIIALAEKGKSREELEKIAEDPGSSTDERWAAKTLLQEVDRIGFDETKIANKTLNSVDRAMHVNSIKRAKDLQALIIYESLQKNTIKKKSAKVKPNLAPVDQESNKDASGSKDTMSEPVKNRATKERLLFANLAIPGLTSLTIISLLVVDFLVYLRFVRKEKIKQAAMLPLHKEVIR